GKTSRQLLRPLRPGSGSSCGNVETAVVVYVADRERIWARTNHERVRSALEIAPSVAKRNRHVIVRAVYSDEVKLAVSVNISQLQAMCVWMRAIFHDNRRMWGETEATFTITKH